MGGYCSICGQLPDSSRDQTRMKLSHSLPTSIRNSFNFSLVSSTTFGSSYAAACADLLMFSSGYTDERRPSSSSEGCALMRWRNLRTQSIMDGSGYTRRDRYKSEGAPQNNDLCTGKTFRNATISFSGRRQVSLLHVCL